jgi:anti-anti-sigma factor
MGKSFTTFIEKRHGCLWIILPHFIDMDNYEKIEQTIAPELVESSKRIVLDFSKTDMLFSSGLGVIIRLQKRINELGGTLFLVNFSTKLKDALDAVGLEKIFKAFQTEEEFKESLQNKSK